MRAVQGAGDHRQGNGGKSRRAVHLCRAGPRVKHLAVRIRRPQAIQHGLHTALNPRRTGGHGRDVLWRRGIQHDDGGDLAGMVPCEVLAVQATQRVADEDVRWPDAQRCEQGPQLADDGGRGLGHAGRLAGADARSVPGDDRAACRQGLPDPHPSGQGTTRAIDQDQRSAGPAAALGLDHGPGDDDAVRARSRHDPECHLSA